MKIKWFIGLILMATAVVFFFCYQTQQREKLAITQPINWPETTIVFCGATDHWLGEYEIIPIRDNAGEVVSCCGRLYLTAFNGITDDVSAMTYTFAPNSPYTLKGLLQEFPQIPGQRWLVTEVVYTTESSVSLPHAEHELGCQLVLQKAGAPQVLIQIPLIRQ